MEVRCDKGHSGKEVQTHQRVEDKDTMNKKETELVLEQSYKEKILDPGCEDSGDENNGCWMNSHSGLKGEVLRGGFSHGKPKNQVSKEIEVGRGLGSKGGGDGSCYQGKVGLVHGDVEKLLARLRILEEDNQIMKKEFFGSARERSELLNEVSLQLQTVYRHFKGQISGKKSSVRYMMPKAVGGRNGTNGLSEVLQPERNPSLVTRSTKSTNSFVIQGKTGSSWIFV